MTRLFDYFVRGGFLMWPLLLASITAVAITLDRWLTFRREDGNADVLIAELAQAAEHGLSVLDQTARTHGQLLSALVETALAHREEPPERLAAVLDTTGHEVVGRLEAPLNLLRAIAELAPLLGFLGTVTGLVAAFDSIVAQGSTSPAAIAGGVSTALIVTAASLLVAVPAYLAHALLEARLDRIARGHARVAERLVPMVGEFGP